MTPTHTGPGRPRDPEADEAILRAAVELLVERGVERTSIEQIARRAGVAKVTVYRRWSSKQQLFAQALESTREQVRAVDEVGGPLLDVIEELLPRWGELLADPGARTLTARMIGAGPDHPELLSTYWRHHLEPRRERARKTLDRAKRDGVLPATTDVDMVIDMMWGAVLHQMVLAPGDRSATELTAYLRRMLRQMGFALPE